MTKSVLQGAGVKSVAQSRLAEGEIARDDKHKGLYPIMTFIKENKQDRFRRFGFKTLWCEQTLWQTNLFRAVPVHEPTVQVHG